MKFLLFLKNGRCTRHQTKTLYAIEVPKNKGGKESGIENKFYDIK